MLQRILYNICNSLKNIVQKVKNIMGEYSKKLHIRKNGTIEDITLYTNSDISDNTIKVRDGGTILYAPIGAADDSNASSLRVRKSGTTYSVLKSGFSDGSFHLNLRPASGTYDREGTTPAFPAQVKKVKFSIEGIEYVIPIKDHSKGLYVHSSRYDEVDESGYNYEMSINVEKYNGEELFYSTQYFITGITFYWGPSINNLPIKLASV